jgi:predicted alpha/beta hydrolase
MDAIKKEEHLVAMNDGTSSRIIVFGGPSSEKGPVLVCMPALGVTANYYAPLSAPIVGRGWNLVLTDLRGHGSSSVRPSRRHPFGYHEMLTYDWPAVIEMTQGLFPDSSLFLLGHSLGGQLSSLYVSAHPGQVTGLILVAAPCPYFRAWNFPANLGVLVGAKASAWLGKILGYYPGQWFGFGKVESTGVMADWAHQTWTGRYEVKDSPHNFEVLLQQAKLPVLALSFEKDFVACRQAVENLCQKFEKAQLTHVHLQPRDLGLEALTHFGWVKTAEPILAVIEGWMALLSS